MFVTGSEHSVQSELLRRGEALLAVDISGKNCAAALAVAEGAARDAKLGIWADTTAIKNAESSGDILSAIGHFGGRGQGSVRSAGWGNNLPEFRAELDTGLCCDYFKAHHTGVRERQPWT